MAQVTGSSRIIGSRTQKRCEDSQRSGFIINMAQVTGSSRIIGAGKIGAHSLVAFILSVDACGVGVLCVSRQTLRLGSTWLDERFGELCAPCCP